LPVFGERTLHRVLAIIVMMISQCWDLTHAKVSLGKIGAVLDSGILSGEKILDS
jgi:hypothetical protein